MTDLRGRWDDPSFPIVLRSTRTSPFGRKVRMALLALGLQDRVRLEPADTLEEGATLRRQNPLGKMPCLLIGDETFFDSHVILEMLDALSGGNKLVAATGLARFRALTRARLADGVADAALLITYEGRFRDSVSASEKWLDHQRGKIARALATFENDPPDPSRADLVAITLASALGYLDWRRPVDWRTEYPGLEKWLNAFAAAHTFWAETERTQE
ncbi:glutathione S-transferase family protein [Notoacmeibacter sp. MSK16QG-6]|uniref:glutathione S-transferase family protein n=1 Tax=Notoacmeibacter sp. MSK16QG-6 TaxID=2957982 RepID=UPI00209E5DF2|nr:glutathione S-transferase family protein [Notoacmeibacter sp. MSK16QG-6]MCP1200581.1 glutathione S-transferase family protein [Notoacmeibacter sp. MSK16QG-6]